MLSSAHGPVDSPTYILASLSGLSGLKKEYMQLGGERVCCAEVGEERLGNGFDQNHYMLFAILHWQTTYKI